MMTRLNSANKPIRRTIMKHLLLFFLLAAFFDAAAVAQSPIDVLHYEASLRFDIAGRFLTAEATVHLRNVSASPLDTVTLHLRDLAVTKVEAGATVAGYRQANGELLIAIPNTLEPGDSIDLRIKYNGTCTSEAGSSSWGGCFWGPVTFAMGVGFYAPYVSMTRHWLPSNDIPSDKATFSIAFRVPNGYVVAGSGIGSVATDDSLATYLWEEKHQTATYLVTYAISNNYAVVKDLHRGRLPLEYYVTKSDTAKARTYFATVPGMLDAFEQAYGPYPFDKVGYCLTPIGSMEHQTMISYAASLFNDQRAGMTAAHELAHQWWGDWVTPVDFREAWLSEGFATFSEAVYSEYLGGKTEYYKSARAFISSYFNTEFYEGTFALYDFPRSAPSSNYPGTIYQKGGSVLVMLRHIMGDTAFLRGMKNYGAAHAYGNAGTRDFQAIMENEYGKPLGWFFDEWVYKSGYPRYTVRYPYPRGPEPYRLWIEQNTSDTNRYPLFAMPLDVLLIKTGGDTLRYAIETHAIASEMFTFPGISADSVQSYVIDPLGVVLKKITHRMLGNGDPLQEPQGFRLDQNYPNPCSASSGGTIIPFALHSPAFVRLDVFDALGRRAATLVRGMYETGFHNIPFPASGVPPGVYMIQLLVGSRSDVRRIVIEN
jgi:aminopeptidase N